MNRTKKFGALILLMLIIMMPNIAPVTSQDMGVATVDAQAEDVSSTPMFAILPVGDHPNGYFDDVLATPGESISLEISIVNVGEVPVDLTTFKVNANNAVNGGYVAGLKDDEPRGSNAWVEYPEQQFSLQPQEQVVFPVVINVPADATPGQHISGLMVETTSTIPVPGTDTIDQRIGSSITVGLLVPGDISASFEVGDATVDVQESFTVLSIPITNTGNYLVRPEGQITLLDTQGTEVLSAPVTLRSIYTGNSTTISIGLPSQTPAGNYTLTLSLTDPGSNANATIESASVEISPKADPSRLTLGDSTVTANADPIVFADVVIILDNPGQRINSASIVLAVYRNGELLEEFPIATNQLISPGENQLTSRYIPASGSWEPGTYTFEIQVSSVDPNGGPEVQLLAAILDITIEVP